MSARKTLSTAAVSTVVIGALGLVAACGTTTPTGAPPPPAQSSGASASAAASAAVEVAAADPNTPEGKAEADSVAMENLIADCMKAQGFQYVPRPMKYGMPKGNLAGIDPALVPYESLKTYRAKYGFGAFARDVFPNDPNVVPPPLPPNPNTAIRDRLDAAQQAAYDMALDGGARNSGATDGPPEPGKQRGQEKGCVVEASKKVVGEDRPADPVEEAAAQAAAQAAQQAFQTNPQLLQAAQEYATCLRGHGYEVRAVKPGSIERTVEQSVNELHDGPGAPAPQEGLRREITMALDDLECGRNYEVVAKPLVEKVLAEGGVG